MRFIPAWYERRLRLLETSGGCELVWHVELDGVRLAELSDFRWEEMSWGSYAIEPLTDEEELNQRLLEDFWCGSECRRVQFRNRVLFRR